MSVPLEKTIVSGMKAELKERGVRGVLKVHGSAMQVAGWPDLIFVFQGKPIAVEAKRQGKKPTRLQDEMHRRLRADGWIVLVLTSRAALASALDFLENNRTQSVESG